MGNPGNDNTADNAAPTQVEEPAMGTGFLQKARPNMSHQEIDRILQELEETWEDVRRSAGPEAWIACEVVENILIRELGYEDQAELEDALSGTFPDFIRSFPHFRVKIQEDEGVAKGKEVFQGVPPKPEEERRPTKLTLRVESTKDLWRVCLKAPAATVEIPELEFEIGADSKRHIDAVYNHIGQAVFNLGDVVKTQPLSDDHKNKIVDTILNLNGMLDVPRPWHFIVHDPSGLSEFKPADGIKVEYLDEQPASSS
eukprot:TRINITY_DN11060_c0_g1_i1.p1 TRINITY_DN11060_c0_g1~~TRINITY_DN11060_c0_g1_i1.p1  ORF type:complete len:256 (+),score=71.33 TRINITY_DN11060_c0_g1_i1:177-944(+)